MFDDKTYKTYFKGNVMISAVLVQKQLPFWKKIFLQ